MDEIFKLDGVEHILSSLVEGWDPLVKPLLNEVYTRHMAQIVARAKEIADNNDRDDICEQDIKAAIYINSKFEVMGRPMEYYYEYRNKNRIGSIQDRPGIFLPSEENSLLGKNMQVARKLPDEDF